jgi:hypothetical protein
MITSIKVMGSLGEISGVTKAGCEASPAMTAQPRSLFLDFFGLSEAGISILHFRMLTLGEPLYLIVVIGR